MSSQTHTQRALIALRQRILSGAIAGGTRLFEVPLAEELEISRTPIRAALSRLAEEGLLERARGGGFFVRSFALADVVDTIELRGILEGTAARLAAERGISDEAQHSARALVARLDALFVDGAEAVDIGQYSELNAQFHDMLRDLSGSAVIAREIIRVTSLPFASPTAFLADGNHFDAFRSTLLPAQEQHRALIEAIARRQGARAESLAREHAQAARRNVEFIFSEDPELKHNLQTLALIAS